MKWVHLSSVVGVGSTDIGLLSLGQFSGRRANRPHTVTWDGLSYLVGEGVERYARPTERLDFLRLSDGPELRALTYTSLGQLLGPGEHSLALMVGLPVQVMGDKGLALATRQGLRSWLLGAHAFTVDGQEVELQVTELQVLAQPAGAYFSWGLDDTGQWVRPASDLRAMVGIADIGFNTVDTLAVEGGQVLPRFTGGDTAGMRRAAELLSQAIDREYKVTLPLHQTDALLRQRRPVLYIAGQEVDLAWIVRQAPQAAVGAIVAFLESRWGRGTQFGHLLFTGGGAEALRDTLVRHYPQGVVLANTVSANATGLARYGRRLFGQATVVGLDPGYGAFKAVALMPDAAT